jgi:predicted Zn-dependent protease with MMP-like domain
MQISKKQFEQLVAEAIDDLPEKFQKWINNLAIFIEDQPSRAQLKKARLVGKNHALLLGLYEGYHQSKRLNTGPVLPDKITIFKKPLESLSSSPEDLKKQITSTVRHEIAHHFGSDELGAQKAGRG